MGLSSPGSTACQLLFLNPSFLTYKSPDGFFFFVCTVKFILQGSHVYCWLVHSFPTHLILNTEGREICVWLGFFLFLTMLLGDKCVGKPDFLPFLSHFQSTCICLMSNKVKYEDNRHSIAYTSIEILFFGIVFTNTSPMK